MSERPWEAYAPKAPAATAEEAPWEAYGGTKAEPAVASTEPPIGYGEDTAKGAAGGLGRGVAGAIGLPGTVGGLVHSGLSKLGVPEGAIDKAATVAGAVAPGLRTFRGPDGSEVQAALEKYTGPLYQPKYMPGQFASTVAEFAPGMLIPGGGAGSIARTIGGKVLTTVGPAIASETAGQIGKGTPYEPWARGVAGVGGGLAAGKLITPMAPAATGGYRAAVDTLEGAGVPLTAGQRTGSKPLQWLESNAIDTPMGGPRPAAIQEAAKTGLDRAATNRVYGPHLQGDEILPRSSGAGQTALSDEYNRLSQFGMRSNPQMQNRMTNAVAEYERRVLPHRRTQNVAATRDDIVDRLVVQQGRMAGDEYQSIRSQIGTDARNATNSAERRALRELRNSMDEAMAAGLPPGEAQAWALNNRRYALQKQIEPAVSGGADAGHISPAKLASAVKSRRNADYAAQRGDLDDLAQAAAIVMKPLPNSGTAARTSMQNLGVPLGGGGVGATIGTLLFGPGPGTVIGGAAGAALPALTARAATSRLGQAYLGNRALPQNTRDILTQTLAQQALTPPGSSAARMRAERDDNEEKLRRIGREKLRRMFAERK